MVASNKASEGECHGARARQKVGARHARLRLRVAALPPPEAALLTRPARRGHLEGSGRRAPAKFNPAPLRGRNDALVAVRPVLSMVSRFDELLELSPTERAEVASFASLGANGRLLGDAAFLAFAERKLGRKLSRRKPGPKPRSERRDPRLCIMSS